MQFIILKLAVRFLKPVMLVFSVFILFRGHHHPGGGFIGGLMAGAAVILDAIAFTPEETRKRTFLKPVYLIAAGLLFIVVTSVMSLFKGKALLTGLWATIELPVVNKLKLGTALFFDVGVYLVVAGIFIIIMLSILEELEWK